VSAPQRSGGAKPLDVFLVAGESSGDVLGAGLMRMLGREAGVPVSFRGVGGARMVEAGLDLLFPAHELTTIGILPVVAKLPTLVRRLRETVRAIGKRPPDVLILIDVPDFSLRVARCVRRRLPHLPIVKYVAPSVWAWRPGRARAMRPSVDLVMALLPFEPKVMGDLGGPPCVYVGHPLLGQLDTLRPSPEEARAQATPPIVLALPGSRRQEIRRLGGVFGAALELAAKRCRHFEVVLPTLPHLTADIAAATAQWAIRPRIVTDERGKQAAMRSARAAIAASGTATLELALAGVPYVSAYRVSLIDEVIARAVFHVRTVNLVNLVLDEMVVPEFLQGRCTADNIGNGLSDILSDTPARRCQEEAFRRLDGILGTHDKHPSARAAHAVLDLLQTKGGGRCERV
jgi:lipid-A-disaccharide synthase